MSEIQYNIHNYLYFKICNTSSIAQKYFDKTKIQFANFISDKVNVKNDFFVNIGPFKRKKVSSIILDDTYYIADNYIYLKDKRKRAKWEFEINNIDGIPEININANFIGNITAILNIVEFIAQFILLKKGISIVHASGVSLNNKGMLLSARSGGGKTTLALSLLNNNYLYLGDNFILLNNGEMKSYLSPLNIFSYNRLPIVEKTFSIQQKISLSLKQKLHFLTKGYYRIFEKINPKETFVNLISSEADINTLIILNPHTNTKEKPVLEKIEYDYAIKKLLYNMEMDLLRYNKYIYSYGYIYPNSSFTRFWENYESSLRKNLPVNCQIFNVNVPMKYNNDFIDQLSEQLKNVVN